MTYIYWVWINNTWTLARRGNKEKWQPLRLDTSAPEEWDSSVIEGPLAAELLTAPREKPVFKAAQ